MLFFRTISLVAALAFATLTSAVPVEGAGLVSGEVFARDAAELSLPVKRGGGSIYDLYNTCHGNVVNIIVEISQYIILLPYLRSLNTFFFTDVAVKVGDHVKVLSCLNEIVAEIELVIDGVNAGVELDVSVDVFANLVCGLIQVRHCFFLLLTLTILFFYSMRYSLDYRTGRNPCDQH